ncbi:response regulator transcription factor [Synechococcus sp. CS-1329]|jgi:DNA-binding NarL/FixJ family response regulator|uniref:helix-turn-helix transcriptional regulator n=1 Tax=Synechococcus sp. CS-1329 TaxID=2847975 RepID=UPI00223BD47E|nr:response regulator transcription factor [Synechococcus sp. CS-1329]MCT0219699.1 response regulator transcription factor [Synechococcus sp. CS-1329]
MGSVDADGAAGFLERAAQSRQEVMELLASRSLMVVSGRRLVISLLTGVIGDRCQWFGFATSENEGLELLSRRQPQLLFVTHPLRPGSGLELVRRAKALHPQLRCLLFLEEESPPLVRAALEVHCDGICADQGVGFGHLVAATRAVLGGGFYMEPQLRDLLALACRSSLAPTGPGLSVRELEVLERVVRGYQNAQIAAQLHLSVETVRSHLKSAFQKLGATGRAQAAVMAVCQGLVNWHLDELP